jgi:uncharacterized membrane protein YbhN (UPF0104 family)
MKYTPNLKKFKNRRLRVRAQHAFERWFFVLSTIDISDFFKLLGALLLIISVLCPWTEIDISWTKEVIGAFTRISAGVWFFYITATVLLIFSVLSRKHKEDWRVKLPKWMFAIDPDAFFAVSIGTSAFFIALIHSGLTLLTHDVSIKYGPIFALMASVSILISIIANTREKKKDLVDRLYIENLTQNPLDNEYSDLLSLENKRRDTVSDKNLQLPL